MSHVRTAGTVMKGNIMAGTSKAVYHFRYRRPTRRRPASPLGRLVSAKFSCVLDASRTGCACYYFGYPDQIWHMMWRPMDPGHRAYKAEDARFADVVSEVHEQQE